MAKERTREEQAFSVWRRKAEHKLKAKLEQAQDVAVAKELERMENHLKKQHDKWKRDIKAAGESEEFDVLQVTAAGRVHLTEKDAAAFLGIDTEHFRQLLATDENFRRAWDKGVAQGNFEIAEAQLSKARAGNPQMLIWLGKQWLSQRETVGIKAGREDTPEPGSLSVSDVRDSLSGLSDEHLAVLESATKEIKQKRLDKSANVKQLKPGERRAS